MRGAAMSQRYTHVGKEALFLEPPDHFPKSGAPGLDIGAFDERVHYHDPRIFRFLGLFDPVNGGASCTGFAGGSTVTGLTPGFIGEKGFSQIIGTGMTAGLMERFGVFLDLFLGKGQP
jgi:hypothetical protein